MERDLRDRLEIRDLAERYARTLDRRDWAHAESLFTEDVELRLHRPDGSVLFDISSRESLLKGLSVVERYRATTHFVGNQTVEIDGDTATAETYCMAHHIHEEKGVEYDLVMAIRYQDELRRVEGRWRFRCRVLLVDWEQDLPLREGGP